MSPAVGVVMTCRWFMTRSDVTCWCGVYSSPGKRPKHALRCEGNSINNLPNFHSGHGWLAPLSACICRQPSTNRQPIRRERLAPHGGTFSAATIQNHDPIIPLNTLDMRHLNLSPVRDTARPRQSGRCIFGTVPEFCDWTPIYNVRGSKWIDRTL